MNDNQPQSPMDYELIEKNSGSSLKELPLMSLEDEKNLRAIWIALGVVGAVLFGVYAFLHVL